MINSFSLPKISNLQEKNIIGLVDKIISIKESDDYSINSTKQTKVRDYEKQIDRLVYKLYGLTEEEIEIIES